MRSTYFVLALGMAATTVHAQDYGLTTTSPYHDYPTVASSVSSSVGPMTSSSYGLSFRPYPTVFSSSSMESESALPVSSSSMTSSVTLQPTSLTHFLPSVSTTSSSSAASSTEMVTPSSQSTQESSASSSTSAESTHSAGLSTSATDFTTKTMTRTKITCAHPSYTWNTNATYGSTSLTSPGSSTFVASSTLVTDSPTTAGTPYGGLDGYSSGKATPSAGPVLSGQPSAMEHRSALAAFLMALAFGVAFVL
ncbi:hypothetical protein SEPCBS119000_001170 [Sporothrix epigloea]|uniref:Uncharacterized protein n=1 Tax=Sporothrix epigloea TaxID=1892477 RepID=A0ABP0DD08_9PEZI